MRTKVLNKKRKLILGTDILTVNLIDGDRIPHLVKLTLNSMIGRFSIASST